MTPRQQRRARKKEHRIRIRCDGCKSVFPYIKVYGSITDLTGEVHMKVCPVCQSETGMAA